MQQRFTIKELRAMREAAGLSLQKVANAAGLATQTVQSALSKGDVSDATLARIEAVLVRGVAKKQALIAKLATPAETTAA